jgi:uncharacterized repeat protein (TIGR01451 family)
MKQPKSRAYGPARLVAFCFFAMAILGVASSATPWAAGKLTSGHTDIESTRSTLENPPVPPSLVATPNFTLNQYIYPGATTFSSLSPTLTASSPPITAWSIGVPILHVITIGNSNSSQNSLLNVTLKAALDPNFVIVKVSCDAFSGAVCPFATNVPSPTPPLVVPGIQIKVGTEVVVRVEGYYKASGSYQNLFSVFDPQNQATSEEQGPAKNVLINNNWAPIDLKITKSSSTTSTSLSTTSAATIHYTVTLTGDSAQDFYPGNALSIQDALFANYPPLPSYTISTNPLTYCTTNLGSTCPATPSPATPGASVSGANSYAYSYLTWPAGASTVIKKGDVVTLKFDVDVKAATPCGSSSLTVQNQASILMNGAAFNDSQNSNNLSTPATSNSFTTGFSACQPQPAVGTINKIRVCPNSVCPPVNWGDTVSYQIGVTNNSSNTQTFKVSDYVSKQAITVPLRATLMPNSAPADVHCSSTSVGCVTTPATGLVQDVLADGQYYTLFETKFTLQPSGSPDDKVTLTFDVKIDRLSDCQSDSGNLFDNVARLWVVSTSSSYNIADAPAPTIHLPDTLPTCKLKVTKTLVQPTNGVTFGQPVSFAITYENLDNQPVTVHRLRDALSMRDTSNPGVYGNIPITNITASCASTTGVSPMPIYQLGNTAIGPASPNWTGVAIINEASTATGITFPGHSQLQCTMSFTPQAPSATDNYCQGIGTPEIVNSAFMDVSAIQNYGTQPPFLAQATAPLPLCRKVSVLKTIAGGVTSTGPNGLLTFQINITNYGNDPVSNFILTDPLPAGFTYVSGSLACAPPALCLGPGFSGNTLTENFNPIPGTKQSPSNTVTLTYQVHASLAGGTYPNVATGSFGTGGQNFYFEGDPGVLLVNSAQVQVLTPILTKTFQPSSIVLNGSSVLTFTVTNQTGNPPQTGMSFTDLLPSGVTITSAPSTACGGTVSVSSGNSITLSNGTLASGQAGCQFSVNVKATSCGALVNDRTHFSNVSNLDVTNATSTLTVTSPTGCSTVPTTPVLTKAFDPAQIGSNGTSTLGFTITNSSGDPKQTGISFSDTLPVGLQITSVTANGCSGNVSISSDGRTVTLTGGQLVGPNADGSGQHSCQIIVKVKATGVCGVYKNTKDNFSQVTNLDVSGINQQLEVVGCGTTAESCAVKTDEISCKSDGSGGYLYVFTVTNNTGHVVTDILLTPPANSQITVSPRQFPLLPGGLANGASLSLQATITGGQPEQQACFDVTLMTQDGECCTTRVCPVLPECCAVAKEESIECNNDGSYTFTMSVVNTGVNTIEHIYLYPPAGVTMTPNYFAVSLKPGQTFTTKVTIKGAKPGDRLCFDISLHTANMEKCCKGQQCIVLPACPAKKSR